jgi:hypothetical protein
MWKRKTRAQKEQKMRGKEQQWHLFSHIQEQKTQREVKPAGFTNLS